MDGSFRALHDQAEEHVRDIIKDSAAAVTAGNATGVQAQIGALFASFMDTERIEALGATPLQVDLGLVQSATSQAELTGALGALQRTGGRGRARVLGRQRRQGPGAVHRATWCRPGWVCRTRRTTARTQYAEVRDKYQPHVARMLRPRRRHAGHRRVTPEAAAERVVALETKLAAQHWDVVKDRDADLTYNPMTIATLVETAPGFDWRAWVLALGAPDGSLDELVVREPSFATGFADLWQSESLDDWKLWAVYHLVTARAPYLTDAFVRGELRLLRPHALGRAGGPRALEARRLARRGRPRRGRRRGLRRPALPAGRTRRAWRSSSPTWSPRTASPSPASTG